MVSSAYLRLLIFLLAILIPACDSSNLAFCIMYSAYKLNKWSRSVVSDSWRPHELQPTRFLHPWDFPGKNTGVGCHFHLQAKGLSSADLYWSWLKNTREGRNIPAEHWLKSLGSFSWLQAQWVNSAGAKNFISWLQGNKPYEACFALMVSQIFDSLLGNILWRSHSQTDHMCEKNEDRDPQNQDKGRNNGSNGRY